jgi:hypothetical protein
MFYFISEAKFVDVHESYKWLAMMAMIFEGPRKRVSGGGGGGLPATLLLAIYIYILLFINRSQG